MLTRNRIPRTPSLPLRLAREMIDDLRNGFPQARFVRHFNTGEICVPEELWFPDQHVWFRPSDMTVTGDITVNFMRWQARWYTRYRLNEAIGFYRKTWLDGELLLARDAEWQRLHLERDAEWRRLHR